MQATRRSTLRHQRQDEHEEGDVTLTEETRSDASSVVEPAAVGNVPTPPIGFPLTTDQQFLASLMETITRAQAEANKALITALLSPPRRDQHSGASPPSAPSPPASGAFPPFVNGGSKPSSSSAGNFTKCSARFDGSSNDAEVLEAFLDSVEVYKECASVSDEHALRGLPMLLTGDAAVWWRGVRARIVTWTDAKLRLRSMYGAPRPAYKVFRDVFSREQSAAEPSEKFVSEKRALLARLPYRLAEEVQVDIAYGLLDRRIRKRVPRESIVDMDHMLERVRMAEDSLKETSSGEVKPQQASVSHISRSSPAEAHNSSEGLPASSNNPSSNGPRSSRRIRCNRCRMFGHYADECRNRENIGSAQSITNDSSVRCYGCGKVGVVRSKCEVCNADRSKTTDFNVAFVGKVRPNCVKSSPRKAKSELGTNSRKSADFNVAFVECTNCVKSSTNVSRYYETRSPIPTTFPALSPSSPPMVSPALSPSAPPTVNPVLGVGSTPKAGFRRRSRCRW